MSATWKSYERKIAKAFNTQRNPLSGSNSRHSRSDTLHPYLYIEVKHGKPENFRLNSIFEETVESAKEEGKTPILIFHPTGKRIDDSRVIVRLEDFLKIIENAREVVNDGAANPV